MLKEALHWWTGRLAELVPSGWRNLFSAQRGFVLSWECGSLLVTVGARQGGAIEPLGVVDLADIKAPRPLRSLPRRIARLPKILVLPSELLLERQITMPLAALPDMQRVLEYEMDRLTPFTASNAHWRYDVVEQVRSKGVVLLRLMLVPKAAVANVLSKLDELQLTPAFLEIATETGEICRLSLQTHAQAQGWEHRTIRNGLAIACAAMVLIAVASPFVRQSLAEAQLDRQIAALRPTIAQAEALRTRMLINTSGWSIVLAERNAAGEPLAVLASLTASLPDDVFLQEFSLSQGQLQLRGRASGASRLIGLLSANAAIRDPSFAAPITRAENGQADIFTIRAGWRP